MIYTVDRITSDVKTAIDRNATDERLIADCDQETLTLDRLIRSKITEGVRRVHLLSPTHLLEDGHLFGEAVYRNEDGSGWILLPDDFMRLVAFKMSDWERTLYNAITVEDPRYRKQSSRYGGIRGNRQKPVCAIASRPEGKVLEFYSSGEDAWVERGIYIPYPMIDRHDGVDICERCYQGAVYMIAALTVTTLGEGESAQGLNELAKSILQ